jgi:NTE family protein
MTGGQRSATSKRAGGKPAPRLGLALGGGGARGLAHIVAFEALDELGLRPSIIAGTSIGAVLGACYAAGISGRTLREHVLHETKDRAGLFAKLLKARIGKFADLFSGKFGNPVLLDAEKLLDQFWPQQVPDRFSDLAIPFVAVATDFHRRTPLAIESGPLVTAVAASMAIPGLARPVQFDDRVLIDGGAVDPLPFTVLADRADIVIAIDVIGGPDENDSHIPAPFEAMFGASQVMMQAIVSEKLQRTKPHHLLRPKVEKFRILDFLRAREIFAAAEGMRAEIRAIAARELGRITSAAPGKRL